MVVRWKIIVDIKVCFHIVNFISTCMFTKFLTEVCKLENSVGNVMYCQIVTFIIDNISGLQKLFNEVFKLKNSSKKLY